MWNVDGVVDIFDRLGESESARPAQLESSAQAG